MKSEDLIVSATRQRSHQWLTLNVASVLNGITCVDTCTGIIVLGDYLLQHKWSGGTTSMGTIQNCMHDSTRAMLDTLQVCRLLLSFCLLVCPWPGGLPMAWWFAHGLVDDT